MILEAVLNILIIKEASKIGFSLSSHHCKSWQGRQKRDENWRTVYHPRLVISVGSCFYPFYPQIHSPFNTTGTFTVFIECLWYSQHYFWFAKTADIPWDQLCMSHSPHSLVQGQAAVLLWQMLSGLRAWGASPQWHSTADGRGFLSEYGLNIHNICTF